MPNLEIVVTRGPSAGLRIPLDGRRAITIGRAPGNALVLQDGKVSSQHARVDLDREGVTLHDLGSKNGTFVDGHPVDDAWRLRPGHEIAVGNSSLELRVGHDAPPPRFGPRPAARPQVRAKIENVRDLVIQPAREGKGGAPSKAQRGLDVLHEIGALVSSEMDEESFLARLMDLIFSTLPADRAALILLDANDEPVARVSRKSEDSNQEIQVSQTILRKVLNGGMSILTADAGADARLASGASIVAQNIRSAMCVPIRGKRKTLGAIYVDTILSIGVFGKDDLHVLTTVGIVAGTALENLELFRRNLQQARMAAIGQVIAGLGHDIRNMLTSLRGGVYMMDELLRDKQDGDLDSAWEIVRHGQDSIGNLVQDMVNYSKQREPSYQLSDVNQVVLNAVAFAREKARENGIQVTELTDPTIGPFEFDPQGIERCVMNLISNAVDAVPQEHGIVGISTQQSADGKSVSIVVQDNGEGIAPESHERIFDLLFSTKGARGTGFGLAITKKIVEEHGGRVLLQSDVGAGARFTIELPWRQPDDGSLESDLEALDAASSGLSSR
jgi:signal transduction histidine kinase